WVGTDVAPGLLDDDPDLVVGEERVAEPSVRGLAADEVALVADGPRERAGARGLGPRREIDLAAVGRGAARILDRRGVRRALVTAGQAKRGGGDDGEATHGDLGGRPGDATHLYRGKHAA